jgi:diguanylate cyclase (GGDEF)-like protein
MVRSRKIFFVVVAVAFVLLFLSFFANLSKRGLDFDIIRFDEGWTVVSGGDSLKFVNISDFKVPSDVKIGDTLVYKKHLNIDVLPLSTLQFRAFYSVITVYLDDEIIYQYGQDLYQRGDMVGSGVHFVNLPKNVDRRMITIEQVVTETGAAQTSTSVNILSNNVVSDYFSRHALSAGIGMFLALFGAISIFVGLLALAYSRSFYRLVLIGVISSLMGAWTMCNMKVIQMFSMDFAFNTGLEYVSLFLLPIPMCLLLVSMRRGRLARWKLNGVKLFLAVAVLFFVVSTVSHVLNFAHYPCFLTFYHLYVIALVLYVFASKILQERMVGLQERILVYGIAIFFAFAIVDLVRFQMQWNFALFDSNVNVTLLPVGTLIFIIFLMASYFIYLYDVVMDKTEKEMLKQLAFRDSLTGLYNRAKCERIFEVLDMRDCCYAIVSIDMNGLKKVNDTYGHSVGDELLINFADVFKKAFAGVGTTIRMGGDEFLAIVRDEHLSELPDALKNLESLEREFVTNLPVDLDAAYGYCVHELGDSTKALEIYKLADSKMYEMKVESKKERKD